MRCTCCKRPIVSGVEATKMIVAYRQPDDSIKIYGYQMPDGGLDQATGRLYRAWHHKCFHAERKRSARGGNRDGQPTAGALPSAYEIEEHSGELTEHMLACQEMAARIGLPVGDPHVTEAVLADRNGGPYLHAHELQLSTYELHAHVIYAHGLSPVPPDAHERHQTLHAKEHTPCV